MESREQHPHHMEIPWEPRIQQAQKERLSIGQFQYNQGHDGNNVRGGVPMDACGAGGGMVLADCRP